MDKGLRILILEDLPADAELTEHELRKAGIEFLSMRVDTREAFQTALLDFSPDIILSDYSLPSFDGLSAFAIARERYPHVPFILVSGVLGEEFAIEALRKGVTDYVLKSNLARLVPVVHRALEEAQERARLTQTEELLKGSENLYRLLAENTYDMITRHMPDSTYLYVSPACRTLFGYEPEELIGTKAFDQMHPEDVTRIMAITQEAVRKGRMNIAQYRHRRKDGQYLWVETIGRVIKNEKTGDIEDIVCVVRDITDRKRAEDEIRQSRRDWKNIFHAIGQPTIILDASHNVLLANRATLNALGVKSEEEIQGKKCYELFHNTNEPPQQCPLEKMLASGSLETVEMEMEAFGGGIYLVSCTPVLDEQGKLQKVIHIATDITNRKITEEALKESEARYSTMVDSAPNVVLVHKNGIISYINDIGIRILGYAQDEVIGKSVFDFLADESKETVLKNMQKRLAGEEVEGYEVKVITKSKEKKYFILFGSLIPYEKEKAFLVILSDITARKHAENALRESEARLATASSMAHVGHWDWDPTTGDVIWTKELYHIFGYEPGSVTPGYELFLSRIHPKDRIRVKNTVAASLKKPIPYIAEFRFYRQDNTERIGRTTGHTEFDKDGRVICLSVAMQDITEIRKAEDALKKSEELFRTLVETTPAGIWQDDSEGKTVYVNPAILEMLQVEEAEEISGKEWKQFFSTGSLEKAASEHNRRLQGISSSYEIEIIGKRGGKRHTLVHGAPLFDENGNFSGTIATFLDITERRKAEEEIQKRIKDLENFYDMAIGRELRMKELKDQIKALKQELSRFKTQDA